MATVTQKFYNASNISDLRTDLEDMWNWTSISEATGTTQAYDFFINDAHTYGIRLGQFNSNLGYICLVKDGSIFSNYNFDITSGNGANIMIEKTNTALIISLSSATAAGNVVANSCYKAIVCNAINKSNQQEVVAFRYNAANNAANAMVASDIAGNPTNISEQTENANINGKYTALINLYHPQSDFVATDVYKSMFMELSAWSFGNVMLNGHRYRMSGPIFALDE